MKSVANWRTLLRVSLRALLAMTAIVALVLAFEVRKWRGRKAAARAIENLDGCCSDEIVGPRWLRRLVRDDDCFRQITAIDFGPGCEGYIHKDFGDTKLQRVLSLIPTRAAIESIGLRYTAVTDESLELVSKFPLKRLDLDDTKLTDAGLTHVGKITTLEKLRLENTAITDEGLRYLGNLHNLNEIILTNTAITDAGVAYLTEHQNLTLVGLDGTQITDECLGLVPRIAALSTLVIRKTDVSESAVNRLRNEMPNCRIGSDYKPPNGG
jgi:hypothetical protein